MQERSAVLKQFPAVGRRTACGHPCGPCGEGLFKDVACVWHGGRVARGGAWGLGARVMAGGPPSSALRTGFDRLRANGFGGARVRWGGGMRWAGTPRATQASGIPAFAGKTVGGRARDGVGGGGPPHRAPALGSRFRGNDGGGVAQGERIWVARLRWGVGDAMRDGDAPRRAPALGSRFRGNDGGGGWGCGGGVGVGWLGFG